jgi:hypothetical protein
MVTGFIAHFRFNLLIKSKAFFSTSGANDMIQLARQHFRRYPDSRQPMTITPCRPKWKGTMTDRERFNRQMHYQPVDRCFNMEFGYWDENFTEWPLFV